MSRLRQFLDQFQMQASATEVWLSRVDARFQCSELTLDLDALVDLVNPNDRDVSPAQWMEFYPTIGSRGEVIANDLTLDEQKWSEIKRLVAKYSDAHVAFIPRWNVTCDGSAGMKAVSGAGTNLVVDATLEFADLVELASDEEGVLSPAHPLFEHNDESYFIVGSSGGWAISTLSGFFANAAILSLE